MSVDPYRQARAALVDGDVAPALSLLTASYGDPEVRIHATSTLAHETTVHRLPQVESWLEQDRENQDLWLLVGALQAEAAWSARGAARIAQTSEEQIGGLRHYMIRARESLGNAAALRPGDPAPWYHLMGCAMAAQAYPGEPHDMWKELVQRGGDVSYEANRMRLIVLTEKWHGSEAECFAFARERSQGLPPGHPLHALIPLAHVEAYVELRSSDRLLTRVRAVFRYFSRRDVRQEVDLAADRLLAGAGAYAAHPAFPDAHQAFAFVFDERGDIDRARRHLELGGDEAIWPWGYLGDDEVFERARTRAGLSHS